jgi:hypothetical protein
MLRDISIERVPTKLNARYPNTKIPKSGKTNSQAEILRMNKSILLHIKNGENKQPLASRLLNAEIEQ